MGQISNKPTELWRKPELPKWGWTYDEEPGTGGNEYSVELKDGNIEWRYTEDRWGRSGDQTIADFIEFGPLWDAPQEVVEELSARLTVKDRPWQKPGHVDYSPIWWAVDGSHEKEALDLLTREDAHRRYHGQRTLLMLAAEKNVITVVERLLALGADGNAHDEYGKTPLMAACPLLPPPVRIMQLLLDSGAGVNARDALGRTPLIVFCSSMNPSAEGIKLLLDHGADVTIRNNQGFTAQDCILGRRYLAKELADMVAPPAKH